MRVISTNKLTLIIPTYSIRASLCLMAADNARGWSPQCDELIICEDGDYCPELRQIADLYVLHQNVGVCLNMNMAWEIALARGAEYVAIMDSDVSLVEGSLREMCIPDKVSVPVIVQHPDTSFIAPMLVVPRSVSDRVGIYDYRGGAHRNEGFDADYGQKVRDIVVKVREVKVSHIGGATRFNNV